MTDFVVSSTRGPDGRALADARHTIAADGVTLATFHGFAGLRLLNLLEEAIKRADVKAQHSITDGDSGQLTYGPISMLLKDERR